MTRLSPALAGGSTVYERGGCEKCNGRGYRGRIGLFELLPIDEDLAHRIVEGANEIHRTLIARDLLSPREARA